MFGSSSDSPRSTSKCSNTFRPELECLSDRIVPSADAISALNGRLLSLIHDANQASQDVAAKDFKAIVADVANIKSDLGSLGNDLQGVYNEIESGISNFVTWFYAQSAGFQQAAGDLAVSFIQDLRTDEGQIIDSIISVYGTASSVLAEIPSIDLNNLVQTGINFALFDQTQFQTDAENAGANVIGDILAYLPAQNDATAKINLINQLNQVSVTPMTSSTVQIAQTTECICNGTVV